MVDFADDDGLTWRAELVSHGRTSAYLNRKVHGAIVQFSCLEARRPKRYVGYRVEREGPLEDRPVADLRSLLSRASTH